jgi:hypothetical protein
MTFRGDMLTRRARMTIRVAGDLLDPGERA